ncbi:hypothetical protein [Streptomyces sp. D2-8]|nr:hypothetical protein [Streptomyces sp. D2-8]
MQGGIQFVVFFAFVDSRWLGHNRLHVDAPGTPREQIENLVTLV